MIDGLDLNADEAEAVVIVNAVAAGSMSREETLCIARRKVVAARRRRNPISAEHRGITSETMAARDSSAMTRCWRAAVKSSSA
jgi:hypothetical protein